MNEEPVQPSKVSYRASRAIELWVRNGRKSKARALREAGYSESVVRHPEKVFGSPAVQELMESAGIKQRVEFKQVKKQDNKEGVGIMVPVDVPISPSILNLTLDQRMWLKDALARIPNPPTKVLHQEIEVGYPHVGYKYAKNTDPFELSEVKHGSSEAMDSYSAM